ncbi:hypothetical protein FGO68_gene1580 [Halteria grandinella]|uniref:Uncharacterized protein n=1 Tax=Halteria grandinella TaxID=5974 RepID=A0A8J8TAM4_HALGN|nr:hypothetical protein FGO68_gene1580 [Halteria grandinella]
MKKRQREERKKQMIEQETIALEDASSHISNAASPVDYNKHSNYKSKSKQRKAKKQQLEKPSELYNSFAEQEKLFEDEKYAHIPIDMQLQQIVLESQDRVVSDSYINSLISGDTHFEYQQSHISQQIPNILQPIPQYERYFPPLEDSENQPEQVQQLQQISTFQFEAEYKFSEKGI